MNSWDLISEISKTLTKHKVEKLAKMAAETDLLIPDLIQVTFHSQTEIAFRAAWILENVLNEQPNQFLPYLEQFLNAYPQQKNRSCQRHYTKIVMFLYTSGITEGGVWNTLEDLDESNLEPVIDATFEWLIDPETPVAVKTNCLDILYYYSRRFEWIGEELKAQVAFLLRDGSAAMQARGKKILAKLENDSLKS